ncbi:hypothetical protein F2Q70_00025497 [Brassica cretica]|uniref:C3H1-type domain-containing protein n=1 Tax=Brassica cretica TaxID=69181 RepID=A0A8S9LGN0_BRACR|nr:hypothetical protein F2Q70_00025497 [Brassica cretica]
MGIPPPPLEVLLGPKTTYIKFLEKSKRKQDADGWGRSDFPIICESCLGVNPYVRMTQVDYDKECKLCTRPFSVFRWRPGRDAKQKFVTHVASGRMCVKSLDLEYGLPVQVRDTALNIGNHNSIPKSDVNRELFPEEHDQRTRAGLDYESSFGKIRPNDTIRIIQRTTPHYKRNRAHICSFYIRGECTKGDECPYRHEMHATGEHWLIWTFWNCFPILFYFTFCSVNDPAASKLLGKAGRDEHFGISRRSKHQDALRWLAKLESP